jgi:hypothetical protein
VDVSVPLREEGLSSVADLKIERTIVRKFSKWSSDNFILESHVVQYLMYHISLFRLESHAAVIRLNELSVGFRVLSAEAISIESLPEEQRKCIREHSILSLQTQQPIKVCCVAIFQVEDFDSAITDSFLKGCLLGDLSELAYIQEEAAIENGRQAELIKKLNKELCGMNEIFDF